MNSNQDQFFQLKKAKKANFWTEKEEQLLATFLLKNKEFLKNNVTSNLQATQRTVKKT